VARTAAILARISAVFLVAGAVWLGDHGRAAAESPFANWAAVVISGDYHAHSGGRSEAFDNARRDVSDALIKIGFSKDHIAQFSSRPGDLPPGVKIASVPVIAAEFNRLAAESTEGCLLYFSSHGAPGLVMLRDEPLTASGLARLIDDACGLSRPTVVIVSACFSGSLIPTLSAPQRLILTAARPDRSSFGCSESDKYPYFDACILETLPTVDDFMALGRAARECVAAKEKAGNLSPASEPQMAVGVAISPTIPFYSFSQH
jgi:hypothetical protein